jgi:predicted permease
MNRYIEIVARVAPIFLLLGAGYYFKLKKLVTPQTVAEMKTFVARITLPPVVFMAFSAVRIDYTAGLTTIAVFAACVIALIVGRTLEKLRHRDGMRPYLMTAFEGSMLGFPLFAVLYGQSAVPYIAMADIGEIIFTFTVLIPILDARSGGGKPNLKTFLYRLYSNPVIWAVVLGLVTAVTGFSNLFASTRGGELLFSGLAFLAAPTGGIVLFVVGYDLDFSPASLREAVPTVLLRYILVTILFGAAWAFISWFSPQTDPLLRSALLVLFIMPSSFAITIFGKPGEDSRMVATTLSLNTLVTVFLLGILMAFS